MVIARGARHDDRREVIETQCHPGFRLTLLPGARHDDRREVIETRSEDVGMTIFTIKAHDMMTDERSLKRVSSIEAW